jgi:hypothetical protein
LWVNSDARFHNTGHLAIAGGIHPAIPHDSFLDLSGLKAADRHEISTSIDHGPISSAFRQQIKAFLAAPVRLLPDVHRRHILKVL